MRDAYIGEIRWFPYIGGTPSGWLPCDGAIVPIEPYELLYALITTTYGGDGVDNFGLPDLRGRVPVHQGAGPGLSPRALGEVLGSETCQLTQAHLPRHTHIPVASTAFAQDSDPAGMVTAAITGDTLYITGAASPLPLLPATVGNAGLGQPHENCAPTLPLVAGICFLGIFPLKS